MFSKDKVNHGYIFKIYWKYFENLHKMYNSCLLQPNKNALLISRWICTVKTNVETNEDKKQKKQRNKKK